MLVNANSNLASMVIIIRIKKFLPRLIHYNQSSFIQGRFIGEVAHSILDIIDHAELFEMSGILLFIDFEKAFGSIDWDFHYQSLEDFNFGQILINRPSDWVRGCETAQFGQTRTFPHNL